MDRKMMFRCFVFLTTLVIVAGCGTPPATATQAPVVAEATQRPAKPTSTTVPPTEQPIQVSSTASLPTPTTVITEISATSTDQFIGTWTRFILGSPHFLTFKSDGTWEISEVGATSTLNGTFSFDGKVFTITGDPDCPGITGKYEAPQIEQYGGVNHRLSFKVIEDACEARVKDFKNGFAWRESQSQ